MTPSNPTNGQPFIYCIMDALGVKHQVVPVDHTHRELVGDSISLFVGGTEIEIEPSDVPNLLRALSDPDSVPKANSNKLVTSGGVYNALAGKMDNRQFDSDPTLNSTKLVTSGNIRKAMNAVGEIQIRGVIEDPSFVVAFENYSQWWSNGETELHYIIQKSSGSPVAVKTQFRSNTGIVYFADDLGDVSPNRWPIVTVRRGLNGTTPIFTVTLDGVYTPS